jgi:ribonuclease E
MLRALVERRIGRRDQANAWIWRLAEYTREVHEEYAVQRWPETKRLLGLLVNSAGGAHARNARRLIHAARKQDRRLAAALLAAALAHTPEAEEALRGARTRMARKPPALARELLRNFPKRRARNAKRRRKAKAAFDGGEVGVDATALEQAAMAEVSGAAGAPTLNSELVPEADRKVARNVQEALEHHDRAAADQSGEDAAADGAASSGDGEADLKGRAANGPASDGAGRDAQGDGSDGAGRQRPARRRGAAQGGDPLEPRLAEELPES